MPPPESPSVHSVWTTAAAGVLAILTVMIFATFRDYGISWDEMLQNTYGEKLVNYYASGFRDQSAFSYVNLYLYGGLFDMLAALANKVSPFGVYETRHLLGGLFFVAGLIGAWRLTDLLAGPRAAFLALLCLATTPLLYGHSFINPKDSPFAWLCIWTTYYACRILAAPDRIPRGALIGFAVSLGLALAERVMAVSLLFYLGLVVVLQAVMARPDPAGHLKAGARLYDIWRRGLQIAAALPLSIMTMAIFWPWSVRAPFNVVAALATFSHFTWQPLVLWDGRLVSSAHLPWAYLTRLLLFQLPEYILAGLGIGLILGVRHLARGPSVSMQTAAARQILFIALSALVPLAAFVILRPVAYNGMRHFLFVVPPLVILAVLGLDQVLRAAAARGRTVMTAVAGVIALAVARQSVILADLHPYEYLSYNALIGGIRGAATQFELDYWGTSLGAVSRGLAAQIAAHPDAQPKVFVCGDRMSAAYFLPPGITVTDGFPEADFFVGINDPPCRDHFDNPQAPLVAVQRDGVTLGYALDLRTPAAPKN